MNVRDSFNWGTAFAAGIFATLIMLPVANGELLYDDQLEAQGQTDARTADRGELRDALSISHRAETTVQAQPVSQQPAPSSVQTVATTSVETQTTEVQNTSKAELMRRERVREEVKNEDILQERLEELRLRDERRRTEQLLSNSQSADINKPIASAPMTEQIVVAPVTERPGQQATLVAQTQTFPTNTDSLALTQAAVVSAESSEEDQARIWVQPRVGISQMKVNNYFEVLPHYSAGISGGVEVSDNMSFELGYTFNEFGIKAAQAAYNYYTGATFFESHAMKQNVFDGGMKLHFLGPKAKFRPFISGGAAYSKSFVNYSDGLLAQYRATYQNQLMQDYESSSYLASLGTGFDVKVSKTISIGAMFKYYTVLSSRENQEVYYGGTNAPGYALAAAYSTYDPQKQIIGSTLSLSSFYSIMAGATFSF